MRLKLTGASLANDVRFIKNFDKDNGGYTRRDLIHYYYYGVGVEKNVQKAGELCIAGENPSREYYKKELYKESEGQKCLDENNEPRYSKPKPACPVDPRNIQGIRCTYPN